MAGGGSCLDENDLAAFAGGALPAEERADAEDHLRACKRCREEVALLLSPSTDPVGHPGAPSRLPAPGAQVGRYVVTGMVGAGGMGVVFSARDPLLERTVALKFLAELWSGEQGSAGVARLAREAQTLARLSDVNVVSIYDVGEWNGQLFLAMEWLDGGTLLEWLEQPRPWREVVAMFRQAGRGLAAAHAAGVIHRDFKPHNILLGKDGRVRVGDFGLASSRGDGEKHGTPLYMAPEQRDGRAEPRSDQFSFCIALAEALTGHSPGPHLPFPTHDATGGRMPRGLGPTLSRGLDPNPEKRFPDMEALLDALGKAAQPRSRRWAGWLAAGLGAAALAGALELQREKTASCGVSDAALARSWNAQTRDRLHTAFAKTGLLLGEDAFQRVARAFDEYVQGWNTARAEICLARTVRHSIPSETAALQTACLARSRESFQALLPVLLDADTSVITNAVQASQALPSLADCADHRLLIQNPPLESGGGSPGSALALVLLRVKALHDAGRAGPALTLAKEAVATARPLRLPALLAEALFWEGGLEGHQHDVASSEAALKEAEWLAFENHLDSVGARAAIELTSTYVNAFDRAKDVELWAPLATALVHRLPPSPVLEARLALVTGRKEMLAGHFQESVKGFEQATAMARKEPGATGAVSEISALVDEANSWSELGRLDLAEQRLREAVARAEEVFGPEHSLTAYALGGQVHVMLARKELASAISLEERVLHIHEASLGPNHPMVGATLGTLGGALADAKRFKEARAVQERGLHIFEQRPGPTHPATLGLATELAATDLALGDLPAARALAERARAGYALGGQPPAAQVAMALGVLGQIELRRGQRQRAGQLLEQALKIQDSAKLPEVKTLKTELAAHPKTPRI